MGKIIIRHSYNHPLHIAPEYYSPFHNSFFSGATLCVRLYPRFHRGLFIFGSSRACSGATLLLIILLQYLNLPPKRDKFYEVVCSLSQLSPLVIARIRRHRLPSAAKGLPTARRVAALAEQGWRRRSNPFNPPLSSR